MNSVYVPVHVVLLLKRLANVVSTLSISNHYFHHVRSEPHESTFREAQTHKAIGSSVSSSPLSGSSWRNLDSLRRVEWSWWNSRDFWEFMLPSMGLRNSVHIATMEEPTLKTNFPSLPWNDSNWSWSSMLLSLQTGGTSMEPRTDPPPEPERKQNKLPDKDPFKLPPSDDYSGRNISPHKPDIIHQLMANPALYDPLRVPRYPIVLCHGLYGFDSRGPSSFPSMRMHYWSNVLSILRKKIGAEVIITSVPGTGSIISRSEIMDRQLQARARGRGVNFLAHSMGGLDCRHLITHTKPTDYVPLSLTTISTPHRGSPFMDWCAENIGIGKLRQQELARSLNDASVSPSKASDINDQDNKIESSLTLSLSSLPSSFTTLLLSIIDTPAYANLTSTYLNDVFNPATPDDPRVKYFSVAGRMAGVGVFHPFWLPKAVLDGVEEKERTKLKMAWEVERQSRSQQRHSEEGIPLWAQEREWGNDGLVTVQSAKWGEFLGIMEGADHWEMRGARGIEFGVDLPAFPAIGLGAAASVTSQSTGDGWGFKDWTKFVTAWKKAVNDKRDIGSSTVPSQSQSSSSMGYQDAKVREIEREETRQRKREKEDEVIKSSTDRLSFVFDWLIDQIPAERFGTKGRELASSVVDSSAKLSLYKKDVHAEKVSALGGTNLAESEGTSEMKQRMNVEGHSRKKNELALKEDLERFYVALMRKVYEEGL